MDSGIIETKNYRKPKKPKLTKKKKIAITAAALVASVCIGAVGFWFLHPHQFVEWQTVKAPTCTENGEGIFKCFCGKTEERVLPPEHSEVIDLGYAATKTEDGLTDGSHCNVCNAIIEAQKVIHAGSQGLGYKVISDNACEITGKGTCADTEIVIPQYIDGYEVTSIGEDAFKYHSGLTDIKIPEGVTSIGDYAFYKCSGLTSITIPKGVTSIGDYALSGCSSLEAIQVSNDNTTFKSIDGVMLTNSGDTIVCYPAGKAGAHYVIPEGVTSIGDYAFIYCSRLTGVTIPEGVTSIGNAAFGECSGLSGITIPKSVTSIGDYAFVYCSGLASVTIPEGITSIGVAVFGGCTCLEGIQVSNGNSTFKSIDGVMFTNSGDTIVCYPAGKAGAHYVIPESVTSIDDYAFAYCSGLTGVTIPEGVISIGNAAFAECRGLTSVTIPEGVTSIGNDAFVECTGLTGITIPQSLISIGEYAFDGSRLASITYAGSVEEWNNIKKMEKWNIGIYTYCEIYCTDGTILSDGTVTYN